MKATKVDWSKAIKPLLKKYKNEKHPLKARNAYEMLVMVVLSAQTTDALINNIADELFKAFPDMQALSKATPELLYPYINKVRGFNKKAKWLIDIAQQVKNDKNIPLSMDKLVELPGIGRKSANVIKREMKAPAEGIIVDLHTIRVANRLGIVNTENADKIEKEMMEILPQNEWDAGMGISFLGREICRPKPECPICIMKPVCNYYNTVVKFHPDIIDQKAVEKKTAIKKASSKK